MTRRRQFLKALGLGATAGLAGCLDITDSQQTTSNVAVRRVPEQIGIQPKEAIVPSSIDGNNILPGQQLRLRRKIIDGDDSDTTQDPETLRNAVFTVMEDPPIPPSGDLYLSGEAIDALPLEEGDIVTVDRNAPTTNIQDVQNARQSQELIEQFIDKRNNRQQNDYNNNPEREGFLVTAPYGGTMAQNTGRQARRVTETEVNIRAWILFGFDATDDGFDRWRIPASEIDVWSYPELYDWRVFRRNQYPNRRKNDKPIRPRDVRRTEYVVSFEDYAPEDINGVLIRGLTDREVQETFRQNIQQELNNAGARARVRIADAGSRRGISPSHFANRFSQTGRDSIVITQATRIHETYWREVADGALAAIEELDASTTDSSQS